VSALLRNTPRFVQAFSGPLLLLFAFGITAIVSSLYIPTFSLYSMWKGLEILVDVIVVAALLSYAKPAHDAWTAYRVSLVLATILLIVYAVEAVVMPTAALIPSRGFIPFTMQGVMPVMNGNGLAFLSAVVALAAFCRLARPAAGLSKLLTLVLLVFAIAVLIFTQSRTSLFGLLMALGVYLLFTRRFATLVFVALLTLGLFAFTELSNVAERYVVRGQSHQLFTTLSGRTYAWQAAWSAFQQSPVVGHGFAAAARAEILGVSGASTLHGSVFDVLVGVGLLGLLPWAAALIWTGWRILRSGAALGYTVRAEMLALMALLLVRASTSSGLAMHDHTFMFFLVVLAHASALQFAGATGERAGQPMRPVPPPRQDRGRRGGTCLSA
jgi:O-antigen ligase